MAWWRRRSDADFAEEIRAHLALERDALAREGLSERDASAVARRSFGNLTSAQERFHESQRSRVVERARQDLGGAARRLWRAPGFAMLATLTLALGIGLSTAVFTVANAVLLRRMPVADQDRLVLLWGESSDGKRSRIPLTLDEVRAFQRQSRSLQSVAFFAFRGAVPAPIRSNDNVFPIRIGLVSGNFFDVLGSRSAIGRTLHPDDDIPGAAPVVVLSHRAWEREFGGDPTVVGKAVTMIYTGRTYRIVGVMPVGVEYPQGTDIWAPLVAYGAAGGFLDVLTGELNVLARLAPGASASQARSELTIFLAGESALASHRAARADVQSLPDVVLGDLRPAVLLVSLVAALLLFITCVNVANLLLLRALGRERELELRTALGASRGRIVTHLLGESCLLSIAGGVLGVILASAVTKLFVAVAPSGAPRIDEINIDGAAILAAVLITTAAMLISGLGPALFTSRPFSHGAERSGRRESIGRRSRRLAEALVSAQIALAVVTLATAGLVTRSLMKFERVDLSFDPRHLTVAMLAMNPDELSSAARQRTALELLLSNIQSIPGVRAVTPVSAMPFVGDGGGVDGRLSLPGQSHQERAGNPIENLEVAAPNYFATLGLPLLRGRAFSAEDRQGSPPVVVISSSLANHFWKGADPVGNRLSDPPEQYTVVGVVPDARYRERTNRSTQRVLPTSTMARCSIHTPDSHGRFSRRYHSRVAARGRAGQRRHDTRPGFDRGISSECAACPTAAQCDRFRALRRGIHRARRCRSLRDHLDDGASTDVPARHPYGARRYLRACWGDCAASGDVAHPHWHLDRHRWRPCGWSPGVGATVRRQPCGWADAVRRRRADAGARSDCHHRSCALRNASRASDRAAKRNLRRSLDHCTTIQCPTRS